MRHVSRAGARPGVLKLARLNSQIIGLVEVLGVVDLLLRRDETAGLNGVWRFLLGLDRSFLRTEVGDLRDLLVEGQDLEGSGGVAWFRSRRLVAGRAPETLAKVVLEVVSAAFQARLL